MLYNIKSSLSLSLSLWVTGVYVIKHVFGVGVNL